MSDTQEFIKAKIAYLEAKHELDRQEVRIRYEARIALQQAIDDLHGEHAPNIQRLKDAMEVLS